MWSFVLHKRIMDSVLFFSITYISICHFVHKSFFIKFIPGKNVIAEFLSKIAMCQQPTVWPLKNTSGDKASVRWNS